MKKRALLLAAVAACVTSAAFATQIGRAHV